MCVCVCAAPTNRTIQSMTPPVTQAHQVHSHGCFVVAVDSDDVVDVDAGADVAYVVVHDDADHDGNCTGTRPRPNPPRR